MSQKWFRHKFQPCLPLGEDGSRISCSKPHIELSRKIAREGIILLKNDSKILPLNKKSENNKIVLLGKASEEYIKGGGGSGDVYTKYVRTLYEAFSEKAAEGEIQLYTGLHDFYAEEVSKQHKAGNAPGMTREIPLSDAQLKAASDFTDTAVVTICRFSGEGWDRFCDLGKEIHTEPMEKNPWESEATLGEAGEAVFQKGDFYLSNEEAAMVAAAKKYFKHIIVLLNVGGIVDTCWFKDDSQIESVLYIGQGGLEGACAAADIFCGTESPSGKLTDTFAKDLADYPSTDTFHDYNDRVEYVEDIFVGYRYFNTVPGIMDRVNYPFGFGLSYTTFKIESLNEDVTEDKIRITVRVTNTGNYAGKEIVQVYYSAPKGKLEKAAVELAAFKKTPLLAPNESCVLELAFDAGRMASYDDEGAVTKSAWVMEKGEYKIFFGNSSVNLTAAKSLVLKEDKIVEQLSQKLAPRKLSRRMLSDGTFKTLETSEYDPLPRPEIFKTLDKLEGLTPQVRYEPRAYIFDNWKCPRPTLMDVVNGKITIDDFVNALSKEDWACILGAQPSTGVGNTYGMGNNPKFQVPNIMTADGPAGMRIAPECGVYTTAWPCATTIASTWNLDFARAYGESVAKEVKENNVGIWLAPGMNIHRSPLCGRNFEYYSEDPFVTGSMAAAVVKGVQSQGIAATPKHFAFNNKETNRKNSDSIVSERAAREIYLRAFEQCVKEADPWVIMSSYNIVNGIHTSENRELLTDILRNEWGYKGLVCTDWWTRGEHWREVSAGNDVKMAAGFPEELLQAMEDGRLSESDVKTSVKRVLEMIMKLD